MEEFHGRSAGEIRHTRDRRRYVTRAFTAREDFCDSRACLTLHFPFLFPIRPGNLSLRGGGYAQVMIVAKHRVRPPSMSHLSTPPAGLYEESVLWLKGVPPESSTSVATVKEGMWFFDVTEGSEYWNKLPPHFVRKFRAFRDDGSM